MARKYSKCDRLGGYAVEFVLTIILIVSFAFFIAFAVYFYKAKVYAEDNPTLNPIAPISKEAASIMMYASIFLAIATGIFVTLLIIDLIFFHRKSPLGKDKYSDYQHTQANLGKCQDIDKDDPLYKICKSNKEKIKSKDESVCNSLFDSQNIAGYDLCEQNRNATIFEKGYGYVGKRHAEQIKQSKQPAMNTGSIQYGSLQ